VPTLGLRPKKQTSVLKERRIPSTPSLDDPSTLEMNVLKQAETP
jgi:hypothetical protein